MDLHKPKPWHGWRDFLKEFATIVLGVSVALAAEQGVEWLHWQGEVKAARQAIHDEMIANNRYFQRRIAIAPCMDRQVAEAGRILDDLEAKRPPGHFTVFQLGIGSNLREGEWQSDRASQTLTHFPRSELALMSDQYAELSDFAGWMEDEQNNWLALSVLRHSPKEIAGADILRLRTALELVKEVEFHSLAGARRQLNISRQLGIAMAPVNQEYVEKYCSMNNEEFRVWSLSRDIYKLQQ